MAEVESIDPRLITARLSAIRERIEDACRRSGRPVEEVVLIGVSKTFPAGTVSAAYEAGLKDFGENKAQELVQKATVLPGCIEGGAIRWHAIGHLQRNKAKEIARHADVFHALDSERLAQELNDRCMGQGRALPCFVQVNISNEETKSGIDAAELPAFLAAMGQYSQLEIIGLMGIGTPVDEPEDVRHEFRALRELRDRPYEELPPNVHLRFLSMGMSDDFDVAIEEGATHIRVGSAIFGSRNRE